MPRKKLTDQEKLARQLEIQGVKLDPLKRGKRVFGTKDVGTGVGGNKLGTKQIVGGVTGDVIPESEFRVSRTAAEDTGTNEGFRLGSKIVDGERVNRSQEEIDQLKQEMGVKATAKAAEKAKADAEAKLFQTVTDAATGKSVKVKPTGKRGQFLTPEGKLIKTKEFETAIQEKAREAKEEAARLNKAKNLAAQAAVSGVGGLQSDTLSLRESAVDRATLPFADALQRLDDNRTLFNQKLEESRIAGLEGDIGRASTLLSEARGLQSDIRLQERQGRADIESLLTGFETEDELIDLAQQFGVDAGIVELLSEKKQGANLAAQAKEEATRQNQSFDNFNNLDPEQIAKIGPIQALNWDTAMGLPEGSTAQFVLGTQQALKEDKEERDLKLSEMRQNIAKKKAEASKLRAETDDIASTTDETFAGAANPLDYIKSKEGFRGVAYDDLTGQPLLDGETPVGVATIGYGFTSINGKPIVAGQTISQADADAELERQIAARQKYKGLIDVDLTPQQETALSSFEYNLGSGIWSGTGKSIISAINNGDLEGAAEIMKQHNKARDNTTGELKVLPGLQTRRNEEADLLMKDASSMEALNISPEAKGYVELWNNGTMDLETILGKIGTSEKAIKLKGQIIRGVNSLGGMKWKNDDDSEVQKMKYNKSVVDFLISPSNRPLLEDVSGGYQMSPLDTLTGAKPQYLRKIQFLLDDQTLQKLIDSKAAGATFGALTEKELNILQRSSSLLNSASDRNDDGDITGFTMSEKDFKEELGRLVAGYSNAINNMTGKGHIDDDIASIPYLDDVDTIAGMKRQIQKELETATAEEVKQALIDNGINPYQFFK